jgi:hypothetical protein
LLRDCQTLESTNKADQSWVIAVCDFNDWERLIKSKRNSRVPGSALGDTNLKKVFSREPRLYTNLGRRWGYVDPTPDLLGCLRSSGARWRSAVQPSRTKYDFDQTIGEKESRYFNDGVKVMVGEGNLTSDPLVPK